MHNKRKKLTTLILSLLLHLLGLMLIMFIAFKHKQSFILPPNLAKPKIIKLPEAGRMPAALLPKRSDHGTEVFFDIGGKKKVAEEEQEQVQVAKQEQEQEQEQEIKEELKKEKAKERDEVKDEKKTIFIENIERTALANLTNPTSPTNIAKEETPKESTEKKKSVLSLAQCFIDHEKGNSSLFKFGEDRKPTLEEMKYYCYEQQIQRCLQTSWRIATAGIPHERLATQKSIWWRYVINEDGGVEELKMMQSSGNPFFDELLLRAVKQTKFPPIPKHFGMKRYRPRGGYVMLR